MGIQITFACDGEKCKETESVDIDTSTQPVNWTQASTPPAGWQWWEREAGGKYLFCPDCDQDMTDQTKDKNQGQGNN